MRTVIMQKYKIMVARVLLCLMLETPVFSTLTPFGAAGIIFMVLRYFAPFFSESFFYDESYF